MNSETKYLKTSIVNSVHNPSAYITADKVNSETIDLTLSIQSGYMENLDLLAEHLFSHERFIQFLKTGLLTKPTIEIAENDKAYLKLRTFTMQDCDAVVRIEIAKGFILGQVVIEYVTYDKGNPFEST